MSGMLTRNYYPAQRLTKPTSVTTRRVPSAAGEPPINTCGFTNVTFYDRRRPAHHHCYFRQPGALCFTIDDNSGNHVSAPTTPRRYAGTIYVLFEGIGQNVQISDDTNRPSNALASLC